MLHFDRISLSLGTLTVFLPFSPFQNDVFFAQSNCPGGKWGSRCWRISICGRPASEHASQTSQCYDTAPHQRACVLMGAKAGAMIGFVCPTLHCSLWRPAPPDHVESKLFQPLIDMHQLEACGFILALCPAIASLRLLFNSSDFLAFTRRSRP
jgi:hypothetical protein